VISPDGPSGGFVVSPHDSTSMATSIAAAGNFMASPLNQLQAYRLYRNLRLSIHPSPRIEVASQASQMLGQAVRNRPAALLSIDRWGL
jgi:hypothetical protein